MTDVVYPLPGKQTVYPENEIKELYRKFMGKPYFPHITLIIH
jgi:hypothetical protein